MIETPQLDPATFQDLAQKLTPCNALGTSPKRLTHAEIEVDIQMPVYSFTRRHKTLKEIRKLVAVISASSPCKEMTLEAR